MALVKGGYLHDMDIKKFFEILLLFFSKKKVGYGPLKNSGEQSRAILALLFLFPAVFSKAL